MHSRRARRADRDRKVGCSWLGAWGRLRAAATTSTRPPHRPPAHNLWLLPFALRALRGTVGQRDSVTAAVAREQVLDLPPPPGTPVSLAAWRATSGPGCRSEPRESASTWTMKIGRASCR